MYSKKKIETLMKARRVNKTQLGKMLGDISGAAVYAILNGNPTARMLEKMADALQCPIDAFFERSIEFGVSVNGDGNAVQNGSCVIHNHQLDSAIEYMQKLLCEKDERIRLLEKLLNHYECAESAPENTQNADVR